MRNFFDPKGLLDRHDLSRIQFDKCIEDLHRLKERNEKLEKVVKASECRDSYTDFKGKNTAYCKRCDYCLALADLEQP